MFKRSSKGPEAEDGRAELALREGLRRLPVPLPSATFDAQVVAALAAAPAASGARTSPWLALRPVVCGAACSLVLTAALYLWTASLPLESARHPSQSRGAVASERLPLDSDHLGSDVNRWTLFGRTRGRAPGGERPEAPATAAPGRRGSAGDGPELRSSPVLSG